MRRHAMHPWGRITPHTLLCASLLTLGTAACSAEARATADEATISETSSAIVHGTTSPASQDAVVMIADGAGFCSGTLIAPNLVLTARHCVTNVDENTACGTFTGDVVPSTLGIVTGASGTQTTTPVAHGKKAFYIDSAKDLCNGTDIALLLLDRDLTGLPIAVVRTTAAQAGEATFAVGYGEDENKAVTTRRQRNGVKVLAVGPSKQTFTPSGAAAFTYELSDGELSVSEAVCHGDSGGPIFDAQGLILGVTSRGADPLDVCVARPDIFTGVAAHLDVIDRALVAAGHPREGSTGSTPSSSDTNADETSGDGTTVTSTTKQRGGTLTPQPNAGCSVGARPPVDGGRAWWVCCVGLMMFARARSSRRQQSNDEAPTQRPGRLRAPLGR